MQEDHQFEIHFYESVLEKLPNDFATIEALGHLYTQTGQMERGLHMDLKAVELQPENPLVYYNLACSFALTLRLNEALSALTEAINLGYDDLEWLSEDPDLVALHPLPQFQEIVLHLQSKFA